MADDSKVLRAYYVETEVMIRAFARSLSIEIIRIR